MFRVLIADDHHDQRELLRFLFAQHKNTWNITEAVNGKAALELYSKQTFDLLITDVKMPFASGIEVAEAIRKKNKIIPILFISGYDDFNYAKKALDLQVVTYLLKPIDPVEFSYHIDKLVIQISNEREREKKRQRSSKLNTLIKLFQGMPLTDLTLEDQSAIRPFLSSINFLLIIDITNFNASKLNSYLQGQTESSVIYIRVSLTRFIGIFSDISFEEVNRRKEKLYRSFHSELELEVKTELSSRIKSIHEIYSTYLTLDKQITKGFYKKAQKAEFSENLPSSNSLDEVMILRKVKDSLYQQDLETLTHIINLLFRQYEESASESPSIVKFFFANLFQTIEKYSGVTLSDSHKSLKTILEANEFSHLYSVFENLVDSIRNRYIYISQETNEHVREAKNYILNHYQMDLNLEVIANGIHITPKYLSELFVREEGIGISKYIKKIRIEKAKDLLIHSHQRIREISLSVGFNNYSYFIKSFRESVGVTPDAYRKSNGKVTK